MQHNIDKNFDQDDLEKAQIMLKTLKGGKGVAKENITKAESTDTIFTECRHSSNCRRNNDIQNVQP